MDNLNLLQLISELPPYPKPCLTMWGSTESSPAVEFHYWRATTKREYLYVSLSVPKMYKLYVEKMLADSLPFVKERKYHQMFTHEYNLGFHHPKGDRCDKCAEVKAIPSNLRTPE